MKRAVLLDFDGTVVDSLELIYQCLDATAQEHLGSPFPRILWEAHIGRPLAETFALLGPAAHARSEHLIQAYRRRQESCHDRICAFPGIVETLDALRRRGVRLAIVTTKMKAVARRHLAVVGLQHHFEAVIGFDDCAAPKPHPEPFETAMRALGVAPEDCLGVGDTALDIRAARAAGLVTAAALWSGVAIDQVLAAAPDHVLRHPGELLPLVGRDANA